MDQPRFGCAMREVRGPRLNAREVSDVYDGAPITKVRGGGLGNEKWRAHVEREYFIPHFAVVSPTVFA